LPLPPRLIAQSSPPARSGPIANALRGSDGRDVGALAAAGATIRRLIESAPWPAELEHAVSEAYASLEVLECRAMQRVRSVLGAARFAPGVADVEDHLRTEPA
jgi:phosphoenolpyruvate synthase/pyruvate phosphate dikinase